MPVSSPWIVQKFGGTSIGKLLPTITDEIIPSYSITNNVAVVCSARSGRTKSSGTTSSLLRAAELAESPQMADEMNEVINTIMDDQLGAAREAIELKSLRDGLERDIVAECENLRTFLLATQVGRSL
jgi:aspartate kinase